MAYALDIWASADVASAAVAKPESGSPRAAEKIEREPVTSAPIEDEDEELLHRLASNDEAAFRLLVERHIDRAFGIALRIVGSRADAEDVVQDTMLKVWTHRGKWQHGRAKFSTWLPRARRSPRSISPGRSPRCSAWKACAWTSIPRATPSGSS